MRRKTWQQRTRGLFIKNIPLFFFVLLIFIVGVVFGALAIKTLDYAEKEELVKYLSTFVQGIGDNFAQENSVNLLDSIWLNLKTVAIIGLLGLSLIGMPLIPGIVFLRGFVVGFTVGLLVNEMGLKGILFALISILPQNIIIVPATILVGTIAMSFSISIFKSLITKRPISFGAHLVNYSLGLVLISGAMVVASLIEAFITPVFMQLVVRLVLKK